MVKKYSGLRRREFLTKFFDLWNVLQKETTRLTNKEIKALAEFLLLPDKFRYSRFSTQARKHVLRTCQEAGWELSYQGLTQLIKSLTDKGVIILDPDGVKAIHPSLEVLIDPNRTEYDLRFLYQIDKNK